MYVLTCEIQRKSNIIRINKMVSHFKDNIKLNKCEVFNSDIRNIIIFPNCSRWNKVLLNAERPPCKLPLSHPNFFIKVQIKLHSFHHITQLPWLLTAQSFFCCFKQRSHIPFEPDCFNASSKLSFIFKKRCSFYITYLVTRKIFF